MKTQILTQAMVAAATLAMSGHARADTAADLKRDAQEVGQDVKEGAKEMSQDAKRELFEMFDKETVTVNFKARSDALDEGEISDLKALIAANRAEAKIDRVIVAAWSDKEYPVGKGAKLSEPDRKLANQRAERVEKALKDMGVVTVDTYTMSEHPTWFDRAFNTRKAQMKGEGTVHDLDDQITADIGKKLRDKGGPGTAVVIVRRHLDTAAH